MIFIFLSKIVQNKKHHLSVVLFGWLAMILVCIRTKCGSWFGSVQPSPATVRRTVAFDGSRPGDKKHHLSVVLFGGSPGARTLDPRLKRALLYQLS